MQRHVAQPGEAGAGLPQPTSGPWALALANTSARQLTPGDGLVSGRFVRLSKNIFRYAEADAHLFIREFTPLVGAPLKNCKALVLDTNRGANKHTGARLAHITVAPPLGKVPRVEAKRKTRLPNDQKKLNDAGLAALQRTKASNKTGVLWKGSNVWRLEFRCRGLDQPWLERREEVL